MSQLTELFTQIANAIRAKDGTANPIAANEFATRIGNIPAGLTAYSKTIPQAYLDLSDTFTDSNLIGATYAAFGCSADYESTYGYSVVTAIIPVFAETYDYFITANSGGSSPYGDSFNALKVKNLFNSETGTFDLSKLGYSGIQSPKFRVLNKVIWITWWK